MQNDDSRFNSAFNTTIAHEGGFVDDKDDPGGATKYGISLRFYRGEIDESATKNTIRQLTLDEAKEIYREHFWIKTGYDKLQFIIGRRMFDIGVNVGIKPANKILQRAINATCGRIELEDDGIIGPHTLKALSMCDLSEVRVGLRSESASYYRQLVLRNVKLSKYLKGWLRRAYS